MSATADLIAWAVARSESAGDDELIAAARAELAGAESADLVFPAGKPTGDLADEARRLAEDVDGIDTDRWPYYLIDWERAGDEISSDYTCVTIGSTDYWTVDL